MALQAKPVQGEVIQQREGRDSGGITPLVFSCKGYCQSCLAALMALPYLFLRWQSLGVTQVPEARQTRIFSSSTSAALSLMSGRVLMTL